MKQQLTDETYANRVKSDWQHITRQLVSVDRINGIYYGYSTEIGVLRLLHHYHAHGSSKNTRVFFSENLGTRVFVLDMT